MEPEYCEQVKLAIQLQISSTGPDNKNFLQLIEVLQSDATNEHKCRLVRALTMNSKLLANNGNRCKKLLKIFFTLEIVDTRNELIVALGDFFKSISLVNRECLESSLSMLVKNLRISFKDALTDFGLKAFTSRDFLERQQRIKLMILRLVSLDPFNAASLLTSIRDNFPNDYDSLESQKIYLDSIIHLGEEIPIIAKKIIEFSIGWMFEMSVKLSFSTERIASYDVLVSSYLQAMFINKRMFKLFTEFIHSKLFDFIGKYSKRNRLFFYIIFFTLSEESFTSPKALVRLLQNKIFDLQDREKWKRNLLFVSSFLRHSATVDSRVVTWIVQTLIKYISEYQLKFTLSENDLYDSREFANVHFEYLFVWYNLVHILEVKEKALSIDYLESIPNIISSQISNLAFVYIEVNNQEIFKIFRILPVDAVHVKVLNSFVFSDIVLPFQKSDLTLLRHTFYILGDKYQTTPQVSSANIVVDKSIVCNDEKSSHTIRIEKSQTISNNTPISYTLNTGFKKAPLNDYYFAHTSGSMDDSLLGSFTSNASWESS